jgi:hypothetical protein
MTIVRKGSINASGAVAGSMFGATHDFNLSLDFGGSANATVKLERRFNDATDTVANEGDRLMTIASDVLTTLAGEQLFTIGSADDGFRPVTSLSYTADVEAIIPVAGPTEFRLNCTTFSAGPIEYRLG